LWSALKLNDVNNELVKLKNKARKNTQYALLEAQKVNNCFDHIPAPVKN